MSDPRAIMILLVFAGGTVLAVAICAISIVLIVSTNLVKEVRYRNEGEKELATLRFEFEKQLALVRVRLERSVQQSKHKADFAEKTLSAFHEIKLLLEDVRQKKPDLPPTYSDYRSFKQRIDEHFQLEHFLKSHRHSAFALFGAEGASCYHRIIGVFEEVRTASSHLAEAEILDYNISSEKRAEYEKLIWLQTGVADVISIRITEIMDEAYRVFGAALNTPFGENTDG